jgi:hypothetical protein
MADRRRNIILGEPGDVWTNDTGRVLYQLRVLFSNSCGRCIADANKIGPWWPVPYHRGCNCTNSPIAPGQRAQPFVDFREEIRKLDPKQQTRVIGRASLDLVESGKVTWEQVVTRQRIKTLEQIVSEQKLTVKDLRGAGVPKGVAQRAYDAVHTPVHQQAATVRAETVQKLAAKGVTREEVQTIVSDRLAGRVAIGGPNRVAERIRVQPAPAPTPAPPRPTTPAPAEFEVDAAVRVERHLGVLFVERLGLAELQVARPVPTPPPTPPIED